MEEGLVRYLHFLGIILLAAMLLTENVLLSDKLQKKLIRRLAIIDAIYGLSALLTLGAGLSLWLFVGKPSEFYSTNIVFHAKLTLFAFVALLSLIPTVFFLKNRTNDAAEIDVPKHIIVIKRIEIGVLFVIPFLAVLMARGVGLP